MADECNAASGTPNTGSMFPIGDTASSSSRTIDTALSPLWTELPREIVCLVVERSDHTTLCNWSCTGRLYYRIAADIIWERFRIEGDTHNTTRYRIKALLSKLRDTKSPAHRVKELDFLDVSDAWDFKQRRKAIRRMIDALKLCPNLVRILLEGDVHPDAFGALVQNKQIQSLVLRPWADALPLDPDSPADPCYSYTLNFAPLAGIASLRLLVIGRLTPREAPALATALRNMKLIKLVVYAAPAADSEDPRQSYAGTDLDESPIEIMLGKVLVDRGNSHGHLPLSLQHIILGDVHRSFKTDKEDLLLKTVGPVNVSKLELLIIATKQLVHLFEHTKFPNLTAFTLNGCRHLLPDTTWATLGLDIDQNVPVDPPEIPISTSFLGFLANHQRSLEMLTINPAMHDSRPDEKEKDSLSFTQHDLAGLKQLDRQIKAPYCKDSATCKTHNQTAWDAQCWIDSCSRRHIEYGSSYCPCICTEAGVCVTMWFLEETNNMIGFQDVLEETNNMIGFQDELEETNNMIGSQDHLEEVEGEEEEDEYEDAEDEIYYDSVSWQMQDEADTHEPWYSA
ncbi:MAG: hypothetical protein Q9168_007938 [Polycauliona sp. 1 TL-2023]